MNDLKDYIQQCFQIRGKDEFVETTCPDDVKALKQDGIAFFKGKKEDILSFDHVQLTEDTYLVRKNSPQQLEWLYEDGTISFDTTTKNPLYKRLVPPPYETVDHVRIIKDILQITKSSEKTYVEYGVRDGTSIEPVSSLVKNAYGVDICNYSPKNRNIQFYKQSTDQFSKDILPTLTFQYAFIDADHSSEQVVKDFENIYKYIQSDGYIFLHDTYPCLEILLRPNFCNDCYKSPLKIRELYPTIEMVTLPLNPGITIIHKTSAGVGE